MTTLTLTLSPEIYRRLETRARQAGKPATTVAQEMLTHQLVEPVEETEQEKVKRVLQEAGLLGETETRARQAGKPATTVAQETLTHQLAEQVEETEQEKVKRVLQEAGLLSTIGDNMRRLVETTPVRHEDVVAALGRAGGKPLSEIVLEQRGPKV